MEESQGRPTVLTEKQARILVKKYLGTRSYADLQKFQQRDGTYLAHDVNELVRSEKRRKEHTDRLTAHKKELREKLDNILVVLRVFLKQPEYVSQGFVLEQRGQLWHITCKGRVMATFRPAGKHTCQRSALRIALIQYPQFREDGLLTQDDFI